MRLRVTWQADRWATNLGVLDHVISYTRTLVKALTLAGWEPRRLDIELRVRRAMIVELDVVGEVPGLDQAGFAKLASVAIDASNLWHAFVPEAELRLRPRLNGAVPPRQALVAAPPAPPSTAPLQPLPDDEPAAAVAASPDVAEAKPRMASRVIFAVLFGGLLGLFGLPRLIPTLESPTFSPAAQPLATEQPIVLPTVEQPIVLPTLPRARLETATPTIQPTAVPTTTAAPTQVEANVPAAPTATRVLFAERFVNPLAGWPHAPDGNAWFANGHYEIAPRQPGRFVAIEAPLAGSVGDVVLSGRFRKAGGPTGGGYGFVVRSQAGRLDGENQAGKYIVAEVSDRGDIGIWQRDETRWIDILPWTQTSAVHQGLETNELLLATQGNSLRFVVNGVEVASDTYTAIPAEGGVGVFVGGDFNQVSLEWLIVEAP